jgi:hypothetical protein
MKRPLGFMSLRTLKEVMNKIDNDIIRLHHYGESLSHPRIIKFIKVIKQIKPNIQIVINTNGSLLTRKVVNNLFYNGLNKLIVSYHNKKSIENLTKINTTLRNKIEVIKMGDNDGSLEWLEEISYQVKYKRLRDLGQIEKLRTLKGDPKDRCSFLNNNEVVVLWNGDIVPCCECYDDNVVLGNIHDTHIVNNKVFDMCNTCLGYGNDHNETEKSNIGEKNENR